MDREPEELQFLSPLGILAASATLIAAHRRLFSQIAAALILPLSVLFLAHVHISHLLFSKIHRTESAIDAAAPDSASQSRLLSLLSSEWSLFLLFKSIYLLLLLAFALLSTAAVVYSIAALFAAKHHLTFRKILAVVPRVWRRLMLTFLAAFAILFAYNFAFVSLFLLVAVLAGYSAVGVAIVIAIAIIYFAGLVWISVVWHVASVVSVLEDLRGIAAMRKSRELIRGKAWVAAGIFLMLNMGFGGIELGFKRLVAEGKGVGPGGRVGFGVLFLVVMCLVVLLGLVVQTVVYFVCKSYHHESIDKSSLADHLEVYLGEYVPLKSKDVQLEQYGMA